MKRSRKVITRVIVFLLLGAIVNVAVAWSGQLPQRFSPGPCRVLEDHEARAAWNELALDHWPSRRDPFAMECGNFIWRTRQVDSWVANVLYGVYEAGGGWPCTSMRGIQYGGPEGYSTVGLLWIDFPSSRNQTALVLQCLWPGFAINTLFYAGILWLLFAGAFVLRRRRRVKRGLCPGCAYPIGESEVCTECGRFVRPEVAA